jgi:4'-phosphopantetheinyl transferase
MSVICVHYVKIMDESAFHSACKDYLKYLPAEMQERNAHFVRWQDKYANLMGYILLLEGLQKFNIGPECLCSMLYNKYGKPSLKEPVNFNISHSEDLVVCAVGKDIQFGVDVEKIRPVELDHFTNVMTAPQWKEIKTSPDITRKFLTYWVIKESVIKADSRGLSIPLEEIEIRESTSVVSGVKQWHLYPLNIDNDQYCSMLATDRKMSADEVEIIPFSELYCLRS